MVGCLEGKLGIDFRSGEERTGWYCLDGKKILRVTVTNVHGGDTLSIGVAMKLKNSLKLNRQELIMLYECPMSGRDYENKIRSLGYV